MLADGAEFDRSSAKAKENTISAIIQLAHKSRPNQDAIAAAGGLELLVEALTSSTASTKDSEALTQSSLAAEAVWRMSEDHADNKVAIAELGGIGPLVGMLGSEAVKPELCTNAAGALASLSRDNMENQSAIARTGAIAPLCSLVREASMETKEQSASALWALSVDNSANKATIAKLGGIEPLVGLLVTGTTVTSTKMAAGALSSLAAKHTDNRQSISKRLVALLNSKGAERAGRALDALSTLAQTDAANQIAVAKAGGIPQIIMWLCSDTDDVRLQAATALLAIIAENATTQVTLLSCSPCSLPTPSLLPPCSPYSLLLSFSPALLLYCSPTPLLSYLLASRPPTGTGRSVRGHRAAHHNRRHERVAPGA